MNVEFESWWEAVGQNFTSRNLKAATQQAFLAGRQQPSWAPGERALEIKTGLLWNVVDLDPGMSRTLMEPPNCTVRAVEPEGQRVWINNEVLEPRWSIVRLHRGEP